jgi:hypothetical protein
MTVFSNRSPEALSVLMVDDMALASGAKLELGTARVRQASAVANGASVVIGATRNGGERQPRLWFLDASAPLAEAAASVTVGPSNRLEWSGPAVAFWQEQVVVVRVEDSDDVVPRIGRYIGDFGTEPSGPTMLTDGSRQAVCPELVTLNDGVFMAWVEIDNAAGTRALEVANVTP